MTTEDDDALRQKADAPAKASNDSTSVEQHPLRDQIELDRYLNSKKAAKAKNAGIKLIKLVPPGAD